MKVLREKDSFGFVHTQVNHFIIPLKLIQIPFKLIKNPLKLIQIPLKLIQIPFKFKLIAERLLSLQLEKI